MTLKRQKSDLTSIKDWIWVTKNLWLVMSDAKQKYQVFNTIADKSSTSADDVKWR